MRGQPPWLSDYECNSPAGTAGGFFGFSSVTPHSGPEWQQSAPKFSLASENILTYFARI